MSSILLFLLSRTLILSVAALFVGAMLALSRCRDPKTARFGCELVLLLGLVGAAVPILPTGVTLEGYFIGEMENEGESAAMSAETPSNSLSPTAPLHEGGGPKGRGEGLNRQTMSGIESIALPIESVAVSPLPPSASPTPPSMRGAEENRGPKDPSLLKSPSFLPTLLAVWLLGAAVFLTLGVVSYSRVCRELARAVEPDAERRAEWRTLLRESGLDSRRDIRFLLTETVGPSLIWRPFRGKTVAVPRDLWLLADSRVRTGILRHELAHLRHRDLIRLTLAQGIALLHWFNPMARWALRRLEESSEQLCDAEAFGRDRDGAIRFVESMLTLYRTTPSITVFQNPFGRSDFLRRVEGLKNLQLNLGETPMKKIMIAVMALAVALGGIVASFGGIENGKLKMENGGDTAATSVESPSDSLLPTESNATSVEPQRLPPLPSPTPPSKKGAEKVPLTIRVMNHRTNQPLAGATIDWGWSAEDLSSLDAPKLKRQTVTTNEKGEGVLLLPSEREFSQLGGTLDVTVSAPGFMAEGKTTDLWWPREHARRGMSGEEYHFALEEARFVTGTIARSDHTPLENLSIQSVAGYSEAIHQRSLSNIPKTTDASEKTDVSDSRRPKAERNRAELVPSADGKSVAFKIPVFRDGVARFTFTADNAAPKEVALREIPDDLGRVELAPGIRPTLVLRDAEGKPLSGVPVRLTREADGTNPIPLYTSFIERVATTDEEGNAVFLPVEPARYTVLINPCASWAYLRSQPIPNAGAFDDVYSWDIAADNLADNAADNAADSPVKEIQAAKTVSLTLAFNTLIPIPDTANFPAVVLDGLRIGENGRNVEAFHLHMESVRTEMVAADDGALVSRWTLTGIPNDLAGVRLNGSEFYSQNIGAKNPVTIRLPNGETFRDPEVGNKQTPEMLPCPKDGDVWEVTLEKPAKVIVRAVDAAGQPVTRFAASAVYFPNPGHGAQESLLTVDRNNLAGQLLLTPEGLARFHQALEGEENTALLDTPFSAKNLREGAVEIKRLLPMRRMWIYAAAGNAQGVADVTLAPGETKEITIPLAASSKGEAGPPEDDNPPGLENRGDTAAASVEAAKQTVPGTHSVTGRLRGEGGAILAETPISFVSWRPVEGKPIAFDDPESVTKGQTRTDAEGRFTIQPFTDGRCDVTAEPTDFAMTTFSVESGTSDLGDLTVERGVRPEFTLLERDGSPVKQGAVMLMPLDKTPGGWYSFLSRRIGFADDKGKVVCPPVKPGEYIAGILPPKRMGEMRETWIIKITPENKPLTWIAPETISITLRGLPSGDFFSTNGVWKILSSMRTDEKGRLREFSVRNFETVDLGDGARRLDGIPVGSETLALAFGQMIDDYTIRLRVEGENEWREVKGNGEVFLPSLSQDSTVELECQPIDKAAVAAEKERKIKETRALAEKVKNDPNVTITKIEKTAGEFDSALTKSTRPEEAAVRLYQAYINSRDVNEIFDRIARLEMVQGKTLLATDKERQTLNMLWKGGGFEVIREQAKKTMIDTVCQRGENALVICRTFDDGYWQGFPVTYDTKSGEWLLSGPPQSALSLEEALALFAEK